MLNVVARVCELLLGRPPLEEESDRFTRMSGEVTSRSSNLRGPAAMNESDGQIAQRSHDLRGRASAQAGAIFSEGDITHIMQSIFDAPMPARQIEQTPRTGLDLGEVGDEVDHFLGRLAGLAHRHRARQVSHLTDQWPGGSQIVVHATADLNGSGLDPPPPPIDGAVALKGSDEGPRIVESRWPDRHRERVDWP